MASFLVLTTTCLTNRKFRGGYFLLSSLHSFPASFATVEKKTYGYRERDELKRQVFREQLQTKSTTQIVYVDEAGIDNRDDYPYGYCEVGQRFYALKFGRRTQRVSWIAALRQGKVFAPMTFVGSCNHNLFQMWLEQCLLPQLQQGDVIVIDNNITTPRQLMRLWQRLDVSYGIFPPILQT